MGRYAKEAGHHAERIQHYYDHGGAAGYSQARYHYDKLAELISRALRSKNDRDDVALIQRCRESATPLMEIMKRREDEHTDQQGGTQK